MRKAAARESRDAANPRIVLEFTYLPDLRDAIVEHFSLLDDGCIPDADAFSHGISRVNAVRRKVAHHRLITEGDLTAVQEAARMLFRSIGAVHTELDHDFLVDRWRSRPSASSPSRPSACNRPKCQIAGRFPSGIDVELPPPPLRRRYQRSKRRRSEWVLRFRPARSAQFSPASTAEGSTAPVSGELPTCKTDIRRYSGHTAGDPRDRTRLSGRGPRIFYCSCFPGEQPVHAAGRHTSAPGVSACVSMEAQTVLGDS